MVVGRNVQGPSPVPTVPAATAITRPRPVLATPEIVAGPSGFIPLLPSGAAPPRSVERLNQCTVMVWVSVAGAVPRAVKTKADCPAPAPGAGIDVGPGTAMTDPTELWSPLMHRGEMLGQNP